MGTVFDVYCPTHDSRMLLGPRSIVQLDNTSDGIVIGWRCSCGAIGTELLGRRTDRPAPSLEPSVEAVADAA